MKKKHLVRRVYGAVFIAWVYLVLAVFVTILMTIGDISGKNLVIGSGFLALGIVGIVSKIILRRVAGYPFPLFGVLASLCPSGIGYIMLAKIKNLMTMQAFLLIVFIWFFLTIVQSVSTWIYEEQCKEDAEEA